MNRAVQGDVVVVEVFDENEWKAPTDEVIDQEGELIIRLVKCMLSFLSLATLKNDDAEDSEEEGDDMMVHEHESKALRTQRTKKPPTEKQPTGRVVGVIKRNWRAYGFSLCLYPQWINACFWRRYVCHIDSTSLTSSNSTSLGLQAVFATPVSRLLPRIRLRTRQAPSLIGHKILVTIDRWDITSRYPEGHFVRALGKAESKEAEQESLLLEFEVPYRPFGKAILDCLPPEGEQWIVPPKSAANSEWRDRADLRDLVICSIDPPGNIRLPMHKTGTLTLDCQAVRTLMMPYMHAV